MKQNKKTKKILKKHKHKNKSIKYKKVRFKNQKGGSCDDYYNLTGKKICNDSYNYYIGNCYTGSNFFIYSLCEDKELKKCEKTLVKIYQLNKWLTDEKINIEADFMEKAYYLGVSPKLIGVDYCDYNNKTYGLVLMEKYGDGTLQELYKNKEFISIHIDEIKEKLKIILNVLYDNNINHNDLHSKNFMYSITDTGELEFKIIDFDLANDLGDQERDYKIQMLNDKDQFMEILDVS